MGKGTRTAFNVLRIETCSGDLLVDATEGAVSEGCGPCHCPGSRPALTRHAGHAERGKGAQDPSPGLRPPSPRRPRLAVRPSPGLRPPSPRTRGEGSHLRQTPHAACGSPSPARPSPGLLASPSEAEGPQTPHPACGHPLPARGARGVVTLPAVPGHRPTATVPADPSPGLRPPSPRTRGEGLNCRRRPIARPTATVPADPSPGLRPPSPRTRGEGLNCRRRPIAHRSFPFRSEPDQKDR